MFRRLALALCVACGSPPPPATGAVINALPASICEGEETVVQLDSSGTSPHLTLVPVPPDPSEFPLTLDWSFPGHPPVSCATTDMRPCIEGDPTIDHTHEVLKTPGLVSTLSVRAFGDRPLHVVLRVANAKGGVNQAESTVSVTLLENGQCPLPPPE